MKEEEVSRASTLATVTSSSFTSCFTSSPPPSPVVSVPQCLASMPKVQPPSLEKEQVKVTGVIIYNIKCSNVREVHLDKAEMFASQKKNSLKKIIKKNLLKCPLISKIKIIINQNVHKKSKNIQNLLKISKKLKCPHKVQKYTKFQKILKTNFKKMFGNSSKIPKCLGRVPSLIYNYYFP